MTRIINFGSCCIDNVYQVEHFVRPGETLPCNGYAVHPGGKGLNQSLALAHAGAEVSHAGRVGEDGSWLRELLNEAGVDTTFLKSAPGPSGHAVIQVNASGENAIVIAGGANQSITETQVDEVIDHCQPGDFLLLQNEISCLPWIMTTAGRRGVRLVFNAAPMTEAVMAYPLERIELFIVNEVEAQALSGARGADAICDAMLARFPQASMVLTLGAAGAVFSNAERRLNQPGFPVQAVDSTGAGDTFTGYFLASYVAGEDIEICLERACRAGALCVTKAGAASSIPRRRELDQMIEQATDQASSAS